MKYILALCAAFTLFECAWGETTIRILLIHEENDVVAHKFISSLNTTESIFNNKFKILEQIITLLRHEEDSTFQNMCKQLSIGASLVLDFTWTGWRRGRELCENIGVPYLKAAKPVFPLLRLVDDTLTSLRNATDSILIFENDLQLQQSLYYLVEFSRLRVYAVNGLNASWVKTISSMLPIPSNLVVIAQTNHINSIFKQAMRAKLIQMDDRWNLVFTDFNYERFHRGILSVATTLYTMKKKACCPLAQLGENCVCPDTTEVESAFLNLLPKLIVDIFEKLTNSLIYTGPVIADCQNIKTNATNPLWTAFYRDISKVSSENGVGYARKMMELYPRLEFQVVMTTSRQGYLPEVPTADSKLATWDTEFGLQTAPGLIVNPVKRFFRIGVAESIPWMFPVINPKTGSKLLDDEGKEVWEGYCLDFIQRLAKEMNFDFELVKADSFGERAPDGTWDGLVGDLSRGKTDIVVASLTMTSEREEVVDFVAPYFEQAGFTIVIRKPVRKTSLFKFMTVLRLEVWLSILGSLILTGIMIWLLDKYSPYSAQNNKKLYPYPCRHFTLKESFWFALTSFTPQGGGEAPKALSGRTLVAAYWLFVVLMLATFTANLAAFLTVERMQSPVQNLDQLARQSRINYTVTLSQDAHKYFQNMKNAEDTLYRMWKEITLDSSTVQTQYRVWDYPIKEQYGHILQAIERTGPVPNSTVGIQKVLESEQGEFALIHDSSELRYRITQNCNLTEIGDIFAEQPFAIAVQQGSQLNEEISRRILDLQKDRYFESLSAKYWNSSNRGACHNIDDNEGITLESLGGVFIATLCGLALAMVTLCGEVIYHRRKQGQGQTNSSINPENLKGIHFGILTKKEFGTTAIMREKSQIINPSVTYISVFPRSQLY
ncbi:uncharacterized protein LOC111046560 [Nilaparvata lugens]|uniref:uncharacterized protein LOC111046560 n=1 Tax=Nilaparvata lugens TaxID=108931 RepID=UPI00193D47C3|nr:uncharacterized protein LOC111046560 [Nilaparvata lugens]